MDNSFASELPDDFLIPHQNGYDGVLTSAQFRVNIKTECLEATVEFQVVSIIADREHWHRIRVEFVNVAFCRISDNWFVGGGCVLYNGGRLLSSLRGGKVVLDLDPGVAWLTDSGVKHISSFLISGAGVVIISPPPETAV